MKTFPRMEKIAHRKKFYKHQRPLKDHHNWARIFPKTDFSKSTKPLNFSGSKRRSCHTEGDMVRTGLTFLHWKLSLGTKGDDESQNRLWVPLPMAVTKYSTKATLRRAFCVSWFEGTDPHAGGVPAAGTRGSWSHCTESGSRERCCCSACLLTHAGAPVCGLVLSTFKMDPSTYINTM